MSISDSIKAKLRNRAILEHRTFQEIMTVYGLERAMYRLSISPFSENFILKGGILLYAFFEGDYSRGTADVDLLGIQIKNDIDVIQRIFEEIFSIEFPEDAIQYDITSMKISRITELKKYPGISVSITGYLDRTKIPVQIDIGFGDIVFPEVGLMEYPSLLHQSPAIIHVYSKESIIAEKFEAMVSLGYATSRMKDFFDIYALSESYDFHSEVLAEAIKETFENRNTSFAIISAFEDEFMDDPNRKRMWNSFTKAKNITLAISLQEVIVKIKAFLVPIISMLQDNSIKRLTWSHVQNEWR